MSTPTGVLGFGSVAQPAIVAKYSELALTKGIVIDASAGVNGTVLKAGQLMQLQSSTKYLPIVQTGTPDVAAIGTTLVLAQTVTLDGIDKTNVSAFFGGYLIKSALVGTPTQITAITKDVDTDIVVLKQW